MSNQNKLSKIEFVLEHIVWGIVSAIWYSLIFRAIPSLSVTQSQLVLLCLTIACLILGYLLTQKRHRNTTNLIISILIPYELYTLITYGRYCLNLIYISCGVALVLCLIFCVWIFSSVIPSSGNRKNILFNRARYCLIVCRGFFAICLSSIIFFGITTNLNDGIPIETTTKPSTEPISSKEDTISNHIDILVQLWPEEWETLSLSEKLNVLQIVANIERTYLGIHHELIVKTDLLDENTLGNYSNANYQITIDTVHLETDSPNNVLNSILHECYHAYQHMLVDVYLNSEEHYQGLKIFRRISKYSEEFASYQQAGTDFLDLYTYYHQAVEVDARSYAEDGTKDYYTRLEEHRTHQS